MFLVLQLPNMILQLCLPFFFFLLIVKTQEEKKGALSGLKQPLAAVSPLKMMKNAFYFTSKALFVLKIFKFCLDFLVM